MNDATQREIFSIDSKNLYGRLPGSWTLPVCDISGYGKGWNLNYEQPQPQSRVDLSFPGASSTENLPHPPCMCGMSSLLISLLLTSVSKPNNFPGPNGVETEGWAKAAGMLRFDTFYDRCQRVLLHGDFQWPVGVDSVSYGFGDPIIRPKR